jgi:hypothetical protein
MKSTGPAPGSRAQEQGLLIRKSPARDYLFQQGRVSALLELRMRSWTPSIVPTDDESVYLVLDDFGKHGRAWREADAEGADLETVIGVLSVFRWPCPNSRLAMS